MNYYLNNGFYGLFFDHELHEFHEFFIQSELWGKFEVHLLACDGMDEGNGLRLEIETVSLRAIEFIAFDGTAEAVGMGAVHSQLMRAAGVGPEGEESVTGGWFFCYTSQNTVFGDGAFATLKVDDLTRTVHGVAE